MLGFPQFRFENLNCITLQMCFLVTYFPFFMWTNGYAGTHAHRYILWKPEGSGGGGRGRGRSFLRQAFSFETGSFLALANWTRLAGNLAPERLLSLPPHPSQDYISMKACLAFLDGFLGLNSSHGATFVHCASSQLSECFFLKTHEMTHLDESYCWHQLSATIRIRFTLGGSPPSLLTLFVVSSGAESGRDSSKVPELVAISDRKVMVSPRL